MMKKNDGVTLIELIIVISVIGILVVALGFSFQGWMGKYRVENEIKQIHTDFMNARARAMTMNRMHFVTGAANTYTVYDDTNPAPDGDENIQPTADCRAPSVSDTCLPGFCRSDGTCSKPVEYTIDWTGIGTQINFDRRGLILQSGSIYVNPNEPTCCASNTCSALDQNECKNPDYDCLVISQTRINMGKWNGATCVKK
jgi:prepilin-type N-terminal cleavage/methylation domain-containing protein